MTDQSIPNKDAVGVGVGERIVRGIEHYHQYGNQIEWVGEDRCKVPSCTHPEHSYLVIFGENGERCNCPDRRGDELGTCLHRISALISRSKQVKYYVRSRHNSRLGGNIYEVVESRASEAVERVVGWSAWAGSAYEMKRAIEAEEEVA